MKRIFRYASVAALPLVLMLPLTAQSKKDPKKDSGITSEQAATLGVQVSGRVIGELF